MRRALELIRATSKEPSIVAVADRALVPQPRFSRFERELMALRMRFIDRKTYSEIAAVLPNAGGTIGVTTARARAIVLSAARRLSAEDSASE